jgi:hypothetical protein
LRGYSFGKEKRNHLVICTFLTSLDNAEILLVLESQLISNQFVGYIEIRKKKMEKKVFH